MRLVALMWRRQEPERQQFGTSATRMIAQTAPISWLLAMITMPRLFAALLGAIDCDHARLGLVRHVQTSVCVLIIHMKPATFDRRADQDMDGDSMGLAVRWYAENLELNRVRLLCAEIPKPTSLCDLRIEWRSIWAGLLPGFTNLLLPGVQLRQL